MDPIVYAKREQLGTLRYFLYDPQGKNPRAKTQSAAAHVTIRFNPLCHFRIGTAKRQIPDNEDETDDDNYWRNDEMPHGIRQKRL
jgi:hypothetical protein